VGGSCPQQGVHHGVEPVEHLLDAIEWWGHWRDSVHGT
jgi:hypothetical protein